MRLPLFYLFIVFSLFFFPQTVFAFVAVSPSANCTFNAFLKIGSSGVEVRCLQAKVGVATDGVFGPLTRVAVKAFQSSKGLVADGIVGPLSRIALNDIKTSGGIYPAGCVGITGYSVTTGKKCDSGVSMSPSPTANNVPAPVANNNTPISPKPSVGITNNANQNLVNIDRFVKTVVEVNRKNGYSEKELDTMANALREEVASSKINYNEEFKQMLIREASLSSNTKPFLTVFNKVIARTLSVLGLTPSIAQAIVAVDTPFGGALFGSTFCVLSGNWMIYIEPLPPTFVALISYFPGTQGFASYNIPYTGHLLGTYGPPGVCLLSRKAPIIPTEGVITPMVVSSLLLF